MPLKKAHVSGPDAPSPLIAAVVFLSHAIRKELLDRLHASGFADLMPAELELLRALNPRGSQIVEIARAAGISKQRVSRAIRFLEDNLYVKISPDPADRRARRVTLTRRGERLRSELEAVSRVIGNRYADLLGTRTSNSVESALGILTTDHLRRENFAKHSKKR